MAASQDDAVFLFPLTGTLHKLAEYHQCFWKCVLWNSPASSHEMIYKQGFCDYDRLDGWFQIFYSSSGHFLAMMSITDRGIFYPLDFGLGCVNLLCPVECRLEDTVMILRLGLRCFSSVIWTCYCLRAAGSWGEQEEYGTPDPQTCNLNQSCFKLLVYEHKQWLF